MKIVSTFCKNCLNPIKKLLQKHSKSDDAKQKMAREDLQSRLEYLRKQAEVRKTSI